MTGAEFLTLHTVLADRRCALLNRLGITATDTDRSIDPGVPRLLADLHTTIAAIDAALAEFVTAGDAP